MMLTNRQRLPAPIVAAISNDSYTKGDANISVTELLTPPQVVYLKKKHSEEISEDASDRIWSLIGQAVHTIIERASSQVDVLSETTLFTECLGWKVKGTADHVTLTNAELCDFKVTTAYKIKAENIPQEWVQQTNIYRYMLHKERGLLINSIAVIAILRDWSKREARRSPEYPQTQVVRLEVPLWSVEEAEAFLEERVRLHQMEEPPPCTDADTWARPSKWAVMKKGRASAVKLFDNPEEAGEFARQMGSAHSVEYRRGEVPRCQDYCAASQFCEQWRLDPRNVSTNNMEGFLSHG